jgi:hypothetical protein
MIIDTLDIDAATFTAGTGWAIKPEGACKGDVCVPLPDWFSLSDAAARLGMAIVPSAEHGVWSLGPETIGGHALTTAVAPDPPLTDLDGRPFLLSSLRGQKVVLVAWAPY